MFLTPAFVGRFIERTAPTWAGGYRHGVRWNSFLPPITVRPASDGAQPRPVQSGLPPRGSRDPMSVAPGPRRRVACSRSRLLLQRAEARSADAVRSVRGRSDAGVLCARGAQPGVRAGVRGRVRAGIGVRISAGGMAIRRRRGHLGARRAAAVAALGVSAAGPVPVRHSGAEAGGYLTVRLPLLREGVL